MASGTPLAPPGGTAGWPADAFTCGSFPLKSPLLRGPGGAQMGCAGATNRRHRAAGPLASQYWMSGFVLRTHKYSVDYLVGISASRSGALAGTLCLRRGSRIQIRRGLQAAPVAPPIHPVCAAMIRRGDGHDRKIRLRSGTVHLSARLHGESARRPKARKHPRVAAGGLFRAAVTRIRTMPHNLAQSGRYLCAVRACAAVQCLSACRVRSARCAYPTSCCFATQTPKWGGGGAWPEDAESSASIDYWTPNPGLRGL